MDEALKIGRQDSRSSGLGYIFVILAAILWAMSGTASKFLFQSGLSVSTCTAPYNAGSHNIIYMVTDPASGF